MEVTKIAEIEEKSTEAAVDFESVVAEDTEDVGPGQHLFGEPLEMYLLREPKLAVAFSGGCDSALLLAAAIAVGILCMMTILHIYAVAVQNLKRIGNACMERGARPQGKCAAQGEKSKGRKNLWDFIPKTEREKTERSDGAGEPAEEEVQEQSSDGFPAGGRSRRR